MSTPKNHVFREVTQSGNFSGNPAVAFSGHDMISLVSCSASSSGNFFGQLFGGIISGALGARPMSVLISRLSAHPPTHTHPPAHYCLDRKPPCSYFTNVYFTPTPLDFSTVGIDALLLRRQSLENSPSLNNVHMHGKCARFTFIALCEVGKLIMTFGCLKPREYIDRKAPTGTTSLEVPKYEGNNIRCCGCLSVYSFHSQFDLLQVVAADTCSNGHSSMSLTHYRHFGCSRGERCPMSRVRAHLFAFSMIGLSAMRYAWSIVVDAWIS